MGASTQTDDFVKTPLNGVGRKISLWSHGGDIQEGQFVDNELEGFGRKIDV